MKNTNKKTRTYESVTRKSGRFASELESGYVLKNGKQTKLTREEAEFRLAFIEAVKSNTEILEMAKEGGEKRYAKNYQSGRVAALSQINAEKKFKKRRK